MLKFLCSTEKFSHLLKILHVNTKALKYFFLPFLFPAFGCRPQYDSVLETETFGFSVWTTVLNVAIPLSLFYRMHSVASLFEVFRKV